MNELLSVLIFASCGFLACCGDGGTYVTKPSRHTVRAPNETNVTPPYFKKKPPPIPTVIPTPKPPAAPTATPTIVPTPPIQQQQQQQTWCKCGKIIRTCTWQNQQDEGCYIIFGEEQR